MAKKFVIVTGDKQLTKWLSELEKTTAAKLHRTASRKAAKVVQQTAKSLVAKDKGRFRSSITVRSLPRSRVRMGHAVTQRAYSEAWYGKFQELGWKAGGKRRKAIRMNAPLENLIAYAKRGGKKRTRMMRPKKIAGKWRIRAAGTVREAAAIRMYHEELKRLLSTTGGGK